MLPPVRQAEGKMRLFTPEELTLRTARFQERLRGGGVEAALLSAHSDLFYFTGSIQRGILIIPAQGDPAYFVRKDIDRAREETAVTVLPFDPAAIRDHLATFKNIGFAADMTTVAELRLWREKLVPQDREMPDLSLPLALTKMVKTPVEIALMEKAAHINRRAMRQVREIFRPGMRDLDVQVELEGYARRELGHQGSFWLRGSHLEGGLSLVVTGASALEPTYTDFPIGGRGLSPAVAQGASGEVIGEMFVVDLIGARDGYTADSTRTFFVGRPDDAIARRYEELRAFLDKMVAFITPGVTGEEAWNYATALVTECDWCGWFMGLRSKVRFLGHGIGVEVNQLPVIAAKQTIPFENGMTIAIEPKIFLPDRGVIGIENTYLMENGRLRSLTGGTETIEETTIA